MHERIGAGMRSRTLPKLSPRWGLTLHEQKATTMIWGIYSIGLQKHTPERALGGTGYEQGDTVEQKLKLFHILFIPFFPFGKVWVFSPAVGHPKLIDEQTSQMLSHKLGDKRTPWYSFSGPILILLLFSLSGIVSDWYKQFKVSDGHRQHENRIAYFTDRIAHPRQDDYFFIRTHRGGEDVFNHVLCVVEDAGDSIRFKQHLPKAGKPTWGNEVKGWDRIFKNPYLTFEEIGVAKSDLGAILDKQYKGPGREGYSTFQGQKIEAIDTGRSAILLKVGRME